MENFEELLEGYLDIDQINEKINDDIKEESISNSKVSKKSDNNFVKTITIKEFVNTYLGINHECKKLKHQGLKSFKSPYIIGVSNDFACKNPEYVLKNDILVVVDSYNNPGTYVNPMLLREIETMEECKYALNLVEKIKINDLSTLTEIYIKYRDLLETIDILKNSYESSCRLLSDLRKKKLLYEIRDNIKNNHKKYSK